MANPNSSASAVDAHQSKTNVILDFLVNDDGHLMIVGQGATGKDSALNEAIGMYSMNHDVDNVLVWHEREQLDLRLQARSGDRTVRIIALRWEFGPAEELLALEIGSMQVVHFVADPALA